MCSTIDPGKICRWRSLGVWTRIDWSAILGRHPMTFPPCIQVNCSGLKEVSPIELAPYGGMVVPGEEAVCEDQKHNKI